MEGETWGWLRYDSGADTVGASSLSPCPLGASEPGLPRVLLDTEFPGMGMPGVTVGQRQILSAVDSCFISPFLLLLKLGRYCGTLTCN